MNIRPPGAAVISNSTKIKLSKVKRKIELLSDIILLDVLKPTGMPPSDLDNSANTCYAKNWQANEVAKMWSQNGKMSIANRQNGLRGTPLRRPKYFCSR